MTISIRPLDRSDAQALADLGDYAFLGDIVPKHMVHGVRRARATFAVQSDLDEG